MKKHFITLILAVGAFFSLNAQTIQVNAQFDLVANQYRNAVELRVDLYGLRARSDKCADSEK